MNKHGYALGCAMIGIGIGAYWVTESNSPTIFPVIIGGCLGIFIGYFIAGLVEQRNNQNES